MLGVHSGFTESEIDNFSLKYYRGCIKELYIKFNFDGIKSIIGNAYAKDAGTIVSDANPMNYSDKAINQIHRMTKDMALALVGQLK